MSQKHDKIKQFIANIFSDLGEDENVIFWGSNRKIPGFPKSYDHFFNRTLRSTTPKACYFSTSTVKPDDEDNLYNRQKLFKRMFCIVLDDIGTGLGSKCTTDALPDILKNEYSWRLETSPDNFQYGYLLSEPIEDLNAAIEFVKIIYGAGDWDSGGALPNKLVRLPCGHNLKLKYATNDELFMISGTNGVPDNNFNTFTPDELLTAVNAGVTWDDIISGVSGMIDPRRTRGATAWRDGVFHSNLHGVVDDALDWLNKKELIINESNEWVDVICPWHKEHTDGSNTAGYKPLGFGENSDRRAFHCFHGHCKDNKTPAFLSWIAKQGGPAVPINDPVPELISKFAFDMSSNEFVSLQSDELSRLPHAGFKAGHQQDVFWSDDKGKLQKATEYGLIVKSPGLLRLTGSEYIPGAPFVLETLTEKKLNDWCLPNWSTKRLVNTEQDWVIFCEFLKYLMPEGRDAEWFLDHLASKVQDPTYRGPCVLLVTPVQGSGRGTLGKMLRKLWGTRNVSDVNLSMLIKGLNGEGFTDWLQSVWLMVPEAKESSMSRRQEARAYESLKMGVDPQPTNHLLKTKWGSQKHRDVFFALLVCSNHRDVLNIPSTDRRFFAIDCNVKAATMEYFKQLHDWLTSKWEANIWHELKKRDISKHDGFAPQSMQRDSELDLDRIFSTLSAQSPIDRLVSITIHFANKYCEGVLCTKIMCDWIARWQDQLGLPLISNWESIYKRQLQNETAELKYDNKRRSFKVDGKKCFARHTLKTEGYKMMEYVTETNDFKKVKTLIMDQSADTFKEFSLSIFDEAGL